MLKAENVAFAYGRARVLHDVDLQLQRGVTAIVGPNAAGKSTLLKCLAGLLSARGRISLDNRPLREWKTPKVVEQVSYMPQVFVSRAALTVFETVLLGRTHELGWRVTDDDLRCVQSLLHELGIAELSDRPIGKLSGGQAQLAVIAQALARQPRVLLMDEPTSNLDLRHQFEVCSLIQRITVSRHISTAIAIHDLNLAARFADTVYVLQKGRVYCSGIPGSVFTEAMIAEVYGMESRVTHDDEGRPLITALRPV